MSHSFDQICSCIACQLYYGVKAQNYVTSPNRAEANKVLIAENHSLKDRLEIVRKEYMTLWLECEELKKNAQIPTNKRKQAKTPLSEPNRGIKKEELKG